MERKLSLAQTPLIAASQAGAGTHPNNPRAWRGSKRGWEMVFSREPSLSAPGHFNQLWKPSLDGENQYPTKPQPPDHQEMARVMAGLLTVFLKTSPLLPQLSVGRRSKQGCGWVVGGGGELKGRHTHSAPLLSGLALSLVPAVRTERSHRMEAEVKSLFHHSRLWIN